MMEVLRASTPMPFGKALTRYDCYQMQRRCLSGSLPPLQTLVEENKNSRKLCARRSQVCRAACITPRRHIVNSRESVEMIGLSAPKTSADLYQEDRSKTVLPELNSESLLAGREDVFIKSTMEFKCAERTNRSPGRTRSVSQCRQNTGKNESSSQSSNSAGLPTVARNAKNNPNTNSTSSNTTTLQRHIEEQEQEYDAASIKADIFERWIKTQQK